MFTVDKGDGNQRDRTNPTVAMRLVTDELSGRYALNFSGNIIPSIGHVIDVCCTIVITKMSNYGEVVHTEDLEHFTPKPLVSSPDTQSVTEALSRDPLAIIRALIYRIISITHLNDAFNQRVLNDPNLPNDLLFLDDKEDWRSTYWMLRRVRNMHSVCQISTVVPKRSVDVSFSSWRSSLWRLPSLVRCRSLQMSGYVCMRSK